MHTVRSLLSKIEKIEADQPERDTVYCWINRGDDHDQKVADMKAKHPSKKILSVDWLS